MYCVYLHRGASALSEEERAVMNEGVHYPAFSDDNQGQLRVKAQEGK